MIFVARAMNCVSVTLFYMIVMVPFCASFSRLNVSLSLITALLYYCVVCIAPFSIALFVPGAVVLAIL